MIRTRRCLFSIAPFAVQTYRRPWKIKKRCSSIFLIAWVRCGCSGYCVRLPAEGNQDIRVPAGGLLYRTALPCEFTISSCAKKAVLFMCFVYYMIVEVLTLHINLLQDKVGKHCNVERNLANILVLRYQNLFLYEGIKI